MQVKHPLSQPLAPIFLKIQAISFLAFGKYEKAIVRFNPIFKLAPADRDALACRANALVQLIGLFASKVLQKTAWFNLAYVRQQKVRHEEACPAFENVVGDCSGMDQVWDGIGVGFTHQNRPYEVRDALKQATNLQP